MTSVGPRIVNDILYVTRINHESLFSWQAQSLVKFNCRFSWQAQYLVKFGMIAGARNNIMFFHTKCSWRARKETSAARRFAQISLTFWTIIFRGRRSIW